MTSYHRRLLAALAVAAVTFASCVMPTAAADDSTYEHTALVWTPAQTVVTDGNASSGTAIKLTANGAGVATPPTPISSVSVRMRGDQCWQGESPNVRVSVGSTVLGAATVAAAAWTPYPFTVPAGVTGPVKIELTNAFTGYYWGGACYRAAYVDTITTTPASAPSTTPPTTTTPPPGGGEYVAMGDSYSSGVGADRIPPSNTRDESVYAGNSCGRSTNAAPRLIAAERGYTLVNAACGGADTSNILTTGMQGEPAQITRLTPNTKLVTMTIGGNDTGLIYMLTQCLLTNANCTPTNGAGWWFAPASYYAQTNQKIAALPARIDAILRQIATRSPNARVVMAGYPFIPQGPGETVGVCSAVTPAEAVAFADLTARTNAAIRDTTLAVAAELGKDYRYADPLAAGSPFMARLAPDNQLGTGCSTSPLRWMNGDPLTGGGWHPNIYGQRRYADLYEAAGA